MNQDLLEKYGNYQLCLVKHSFAYFTNCPLELQWGDDWDDAPYQYNAGSPCRDHKENDEWVKHDVFNVFIASGFESPSDYDHLAGYESLSVDDINNGAKPWLKTDRCDVAGGYTYVEIGAGATFAEFLQKVDEAKGTLYFPSEWVLSKAVA